MARLNPSRAGDTMNCPAAAAAMMRYLRTGDVVAAEVGDPDEDAFETTGTRKSASTWAAIKASLTRDGQYVGVYARRTPEAQRATGYAEEHWFVLARSGGRLHILDASLRMVLSGGDVDEFVVQNQLSGYARIVGDIHARLVRGAQRDRELGIEPPRAEPSPAPARNRRRRRPRPRSRRQATRRADRMPTTSSRSSFRGAVGNRTGIRLISREPDRGRLAAEAARSLPTGIEFGSWITDPDAAIRFNEDYWTLRYYLVQQSQRTASGLVVEESRSFRTPAELMEFRNSHPRWTESTLIIRLRPNGDANAALNDLFDPDSADEYSLDCYLASLLVQFRALQLQYQRDPARGRTRHERIRSFNRDYGSHLFRVVGTDSTALPVGIGLEQVDIGRDIPMDQPRLFSRHLRPGDWVTIHNPYMPERHAFRRENATYLGGSCFQGHPLGVFNAKQYAEHLIARDIYMYPGVTARVEWILENSYISRWIFRPPRSQPQQHHSARQRAAAADVR